MRLEVVGVCGLKGLSQALEPVFLLVELLKVAPVQVGISRNTPEVVANSLLLIVDFLALAVELRDRPAGVLDRAFKLGARPMCPASPRPR